MKIKTIKVSIKKNFEVGPYKHIHIEYGAEAEVQKTTVNQSFRQLTAIVEKELNDRIVKMKKRYERAKYEEPFTDNTLDYDLADSIT